MALVKTNRNMESELPKVKVDRVNINVSSSPNKSTIVSDLCEMKLDQKNVISSSEFSPVTNESDDVQRFGGIAIGLASFFTEDLLSHPFIVLRRQCQVNPKLKRYHLTPISLIPVTVSLHRRQGFNTLWKGIGSVFFLRGLRAASEKIISDVTSFPRTVSRDNYLKSNISCLILKGLSLVLVSPFYSANLVESVQSDIASEKPGVIDFLKEGLCRLMTCRKADTTRLLPVWMFAAPMFTFGVLQYSISSIVQSITLKLMQSYVQNRYEKQGDVPKYSPALSDTYYCELVASFTGHLVTDVLMYPLETVINRLHLQGTRTIIDNLDSGLSVVPIISGYEGFFDCFKSIVEDEGASGLFNGFGALIIQYSLHAFILQGTRLILDEVISLYRSSKSNKVSSHTKLKSKEC